MRTDLHKVGSDGDPGNLLQARDIPWRGTKFWTLPGIVPLTFAITASTALIAQTDPAKLDSLQVVEALSEHGANRSKVHDAERARIQWPVGPLPAHSPRMTTAAPFFFKGATRDRELAIECLAAAAWYEAGNDPTGQRSVIQVILNRLSHPAFPKTVCGVVFQGSERKTGCQFTFTCDGSLARRAPSAVAWKNARNRAEQALNGTIDQTVQQATHYHADYVVPWWSHGMQRLSQVGAHIFYRWPGRPGRLSTTPQPSPELCIPALGRMDRSDCSPPRIGTMRDDAEGAGPNRALAPAVQAAEDAFPARSSGGGQLQPFLLVVADYVPNGQWAMAALRKCSGFKACQVLAYGSPSEVERNRHLPANERDRPVFVFIRDQVSGMDVALWDCARVKRPQPDQCLPLEDRELHRLVRDRPS